MNNLMGISLGDVTGVGPEVTLKALALEAAADQTRYLLIGDMEQARRVEQQLGLKLSLKPYEGQSSSGRFLLCQPLPEPLPES